MHMSEEQLQDPANWDFERAEKRPGVKKTRAVVSVAFSQEDYDDVLDAAERRGMRTSEFIRSAALDRARATPSVEVVFVGSNPVTTEACWSCVPGPQEDLASSWTPSALETV